MRLIFLLLLAVQAGCLAADDPAVLAAGDWSEPVRGRSEHFLLRGRLLLCESPKDKSPAVYVEFQECDESWGATLDIYFNPHGAFTYLPTPENKGKERTVKSSTVWEMRDDADQPIPTQGGAFSGGTPREGWIALSCDATVRLRASAYVAGRMPDGRLNIFLVPQQWIVPMRSPGDYFLSCTITVDPPADYVAPRGHRVWRGILKLPKMKLPVQKP